MFSTDFLTATSRVAPAQTDSASAASAAAASKTTASLYPVNQFSEAASFLANRRIDASTGIVYGGNKDYIVGELDAADKLAGLAMLCLKERDYARAQQFMQEATDIRNAVRPMLNPSQQASLDKVMGLQQDAYTKLSDNNWFSRFFNSFQAEMGLAQASAESAKLRNSVLSEGTLKTQF
jgi:hypothetical protein